MSELHYFLLETINHFNSINKPVTWYQLDRLICSFGLHKYLNQLTIALDRLEMEGFIIQRSNEGKPKQLFITGNGIKELSRLKS
jgi:DNA-binding PadR family transcriptional regulator